VDPAHRGAGAGKALLTRLAQICVERGWTRLEWAVLTWNEPAIAFYETLGSTPMNEWQTRRLHGETLRSLGTA
jgi:GNAT superfamily N-acetyltransferase